MVSLEGMEPSKFDSMRKAAKAIGVEEGVVRYVRNNGRDFIKRSEGGSVEAFSIKWCCLTHLKCLTVPSNANPFGRTQQEQ